MRIKRRHSWKVELEKAKRIQEELSRDLVLHGGPTRIKRIAGADVSYSKKSDEFFAAVLVMDIGDMEVLEVSRSTGRVSFPYIPGYLTFREGPVLIRAFMDLETVPDAVIFDGQGIAHPRLLGIASHMGLFLDIPTIGCAKSRLVGKHKEPGNKKGSMAPLIHGGKKVGYALRTRDRVKPVYVSPGHMTGLKQAVEVVLKSLSGYRIPEPVRLSHLEANRMRREVEE